MSQKRMLHDKFFESLSVAEWTLRQRYLVLGMIAFADDQGRLPADPRWLRSKIFPYDDIPTSEIADDLAAVAAKNDTIIVFRSGETGREYVQFQKWWEYQNAQWAAASEHPAPAGWQDHIRVMMYESETGAKDNARWVMTKNWFSAADRTAYKQPDTPMPPPDDTPDEAADVLPNALPNGMGQSISIKNKSKDLRAKNKSEEPPQPPKGGKRVKPVTELPIPDSLDTPVFGEAWSQWQEHRREKKRPLTFLAAKKQLEQFTVWGMERSLAAIGYSIRQGWQGIYEETAAPPRASPNGHNPNVPRGKAGLEEFKRRRREVEAEHGND